MLSIFWSCLLYTSDAADEGLGKSVGSIDHLNYDRSWICYE